MPLQVWKLGGSLLDLPDLADRLQQYKRFVGEDTPVIIIPGGGPFADAVRGFDEIHHLATDVSHELAMYTMRLSAKLVAALLGQEPVVTPAVQDARLAHWSTNSSESVEVWDIYALWQRDFRILSHRWGPIPCDWSLTSDSMAAILAAAWGAKRLVLLKSTEVRTGSSPEEWSVEGQVDVAFPHFARHVSQITWVNLRTPTGFGNAQKKRPE